MATMMPITNATTSPIHTRPKMKSIALSPVLLPPSSDAGTFPLAESYWHARGSDNTYSKTTPDR